MNMSSFSTEKGDILTSKGNCDEIHQPKSADEDSFLSVQARREDVWIHIWYGGKVSGLQSS